MSLVGQRVRWATPMHAFETEEVLTVVLDKGDRLMVTSSFHADWQHKPKSCVPRAHVTLIEEQHEKETL